jgi:hypothetical protein
MGIVTIELTRKHAVCFTLLVAVQTLGFWTGGPLKPGFGLSGDVHCAQTGCLGQSTFVSCLGKRGLCESEWTARRRERDQGKLCRSGPLPHSSQNQA